MKNSKLVQTVNFVFENELSIADPASGNFTEGIPVGKVSQAFDEIQLYKRLAAITLLANAILATIGAIYLI